MPGGQKWPPEQAPLETLVEVEGTQTAAETVVTSVHVSLQRTASTTAANAQSGSAKQARAPNTCRETKVLGATQKKQIGKLALAQKKKSRARATKPWKKKKGGKGGNTPEERAQGQKDKGVAKEAIGAK